MAELSNYETMPMRPKPTSPYSASATKPAPATNTTCTWTTYLVGHNEHTCAGLCNGIAKVWRKMRPIRLNSILLLSVCHHLTSPGVVHFSRALQRDEDIWARWKVCRARHEDYGFIFVQSNMLTWTAISNNVEVGECWGVWWARMRNR